MRPRTFSTCPGEGLPACLHVYQAAFTPEATNFVCSLVVRSCPPNELSEADSDAWPAAAAVAPAVEIFKF